MFAVLWAFQLERGMRDRDGEVVLYAAGECVQNVGSLVLVQLGLDGDVSRQGYHSCRNGRGMQVMHVFDSLNMEHMLTHRCQFQAGWCLDRKSVV